MEYSVIELYSCMRGSCVELGRAMNNSYMYIASDVHTKVKLG